MNRRQRFIRKILYVCAIVALLLPLSWLSQPETEESKGGVLPQMRREHNLSQAALGEIDPASETIKLATLGMRGVAANILWEKANYYKKTEDWASLSATLEQIVKLQPNFVSVWIYQGWNLSYNISVEFDDYKDRYFWVIKGINFLKEGTTYNEKEPRLLSEIGETIARKIGRADERVQFRRLFKEDDEFNGPLTRSERDNWLVGRKWLLDAQSLVEQGVPLRGKSPLLFYAQPPMCLINYSEALEEEGVFGEVAKNAWRKAADAWTVYSNRDLPGVDNFTIRLADKEAYDERLQKAAAELQRVTPAGLVEKIQAERLATLTKEEREAYEEEPGEMTAELEQLRGSALFKLRITPTEIAERITGDNHKIALRAAEEAIRAGELSQYIDTERGTVNYDYWLLRCKVEPSDDALEARKLIYDADRGFLSARLVDSADLYNRGWKKWRKVLDDHPAMLDDVNTTDELMESVSHYRNLLHQLSEPFPKPFILQDVLDADVKFHGPDVEAGPEPAPQANGEQGTGDGKQEEDGKKDAETSEPGTTKT